MAPKFFLFRWWNNRTELQLVPFHLNPNRSMGQDDCYAPPRPKANLLLLFLFFVLSACQSWTAPRPLFANPIPFGEHYSPRENLEAIDIEVLSRARKRIDIAMYAFTDRNLARTLVDLAARGVKIRIYRDRIQVRDRNDRSRELLRSPNIRIAIKRNSSRNIMHLKAYLVDGKILRTGSANWSPPGEGAYRCRKGSDACQTGRFQQDNNLFLTDNPGLARSFERTFDRLWSRPNNLRDPKGYIERTRTKSHRSHRRRYHYRND
ncbi:MAG: phospholipase D-like domain-containing protein [Leptospirales bacterium]